MDQLVLVHDGQVQVLMEVKKVGVDLPFEHASQLFRYFAVTQARIAILTNGMDVTQVNSFTQDIVKGVVIILAVSLTIDRSKYAFIK